jgi:hypothetical protein
VGGGRDCVWVPAVEEEAWSAIAKTLLKGDCAERVRYI